MYAGSDGKTYREKGDWTKKGVNASHALEDIHDYVRNLGERSLRHPHDPLQDIPYQSIHDYVETMRASCHPDGPFTWAGENAKYNQFLAIALHHLPPGKAMLIKNDAPIPDNYLLVGKNWPGDDRTSGKLGGESGNLAATKSPESASDVSMDPSGESGNLAAAGSEGAKPSRAPSGESGNLAAAGASAGGGSGNLEATSAKGGTTSYRAHKRMRKRNVDYGPTPFAKTEPASIPGYQYQYMKDEDAQDLADDVDIVYHGTYPMLVPQILSEGLLPTLGAGSDAVQAHYGVVTPGVYVSPDWRCASQYPMQETTGPIKVGNRNFSNYNGSTLVATDGTFPLRT